MQYPVSMALQDYMTVIFSGIGLIVLTRMILQLDQNLGRMAMIGTILIITGGLFKATGKLVMSLGGPDIAVLNLSLFPLAAPGFTLVAWSLFQVRRIFRSKPIMRMPWLVPLIALGIFGAGSLAIGMAGGPWRVPLILLSSISNTSMLILLIMAAWGRKMWTTGAFFLTALVVMLVMSQLAGREFGLGMIWFEQISQTIAQMLFAIGTWQYSQAALANYRRLVPQFA
jgi:hypothetical protein